MRHGPLLLRHHGGVPDLRPERFPQAGGPGLPHLAPRTAAAWALTSDGLTLSEVDPAAVDLRVRSVSP
ncbi:MAG: hypothetical protein ACXVGR_13710 [Mycobacteriaceae bacterium]